MSPSCVTGKSPVKAFRQFAPGAGGLFDRRERSEIMRYAVFDDAREEFPTFVRVNTFYAGDGARSCSGIGDISRKVRFSEVIGSIVRPVAVDMVNDIGNRATVDDKPRDSVKQEPFPVDMRSEIAVRTQASGRRPFVTSVPAPPFHLVFELGDRPFAPGENACFRVVTQYLADMVDVGQCPDSHAALPEGVSWPGMRRRGNAVVSRPEV